MLAWLELRADEIFDSLADPPHARISFACRAEQLHDFGRQRWRIEQGPAFIENRDAWQSSLTRCARGHGVGDEHAHRSFESRGRAQTLHIEEEPVAIKPHGGLYVEQPGVDPFLTCPCSKFYGGEARFRHGALPLFFVTPVCPLLAQVI